MEENPQLENNSFMKSDKQAREDDPFIHDENKRNELGESPLLNNLKSKIRPTLSKTKEEEAVDKSKGPDVFKGAYKTVNVKILSRLLGSGGGYYDFKSLYGKTIDGVRISSEMVKELVDLRAKALSKFSSDVSKKSLQIFANGIARTQPHLKDNDPGKYGANKVFLKILGDKTGVTPKPW